MNAEAEKEVKGAPKDEAKIKALNDKLKAQKAKIEQIITEVTKLAQMEMEDVVKKLGGAAKNPQLEMLLKSKLIQFRIDVLNSEVAALKKIGDEAGAANITKEVETQTKKSEEVLKNFDTAKPIEYKEGDNVIYLLKDKKKEDWDKLTPDEKKKPTEGKAKDIVGVHKIVKIDGDKYTIEDADGKPSITKTGAELIGPAEGGAGAIDIKPGVSVVYKREKFDENEWKKLTDDDKKKPNEGKMKELQDKEMIGIKKVKELKGDEVSFEDADFKKKKDEILSTTEESTGGEEDLKNAIEKVKPEDKGKISKVAQIFAEPDKNKDKIAEIEKVLGGGEEGK